MRSVRTAKRLRVLSWLVTLYGLAVVVGGIVGGVLLYRYVRTTDSVVTDEGFYIPAFTTKPYEWEGVAVAVGALVLGTFVIVLAELMRLRAHSVIEDRGGQPRGQSARARREDPLRATFATQPASVPESASTATSLTSPASPPVKTRRSRRVRGGERVQVLTASESELLASTPPPSFTEGWYPDPLGDSDLRRWNGKQWTGEQRTIALPQI